MSDENKRVDEEVEKTVEDLKKQIEDINREAEEAGSQQSEEVKLSKIWLVLWPGISTAPKRRPMRAWRRRSRRCSRNRWQ